MFKKIIILFTLLFLSFGSHIAFGANSAPEVNCIGLPGCESSTITDPKSADLSDKLGTKVIANATGYLIQIVSVMAVFALIFSGAMYLASSGDEEKANKAKKWIIWSLVGVFLSISAWGIIGFINGLTING